MTNNAFASRRLLAVFAHPDDESLAAGGLIAKCAALGVVVSLLCLTRGSHGRRTAGPQAPDLARRRERELVAAARTLGVTDVILLDHEDGMLPWLDHARLESDIADVIASRRPDVVVTFDADGLYWHPDHIAVHERTTAVVRQLARSRGAGVAPALYYATMPPGAMRAVADRTRDIGEHDDAPLDILGVGDADAFGTQAPSPSLVLDVSAHATTKLDALQCHTSQVSGGALELLQAGDAAALLGLEHYRRADAAGPDDPFIEHLNDH